MIGGEVAYFEKGPAHLNGEEALAYVRMRKQDPLGDMARNERQREVLTVLMDKLVSTEGLLNLNKILKAVGSNLTHNFNTEDIPSLANTYRKSKNNLLRYEFRSEGANINGVWYELWSTRERERVSTLLQKQLEYQPSTPLDPSPLSEWEENFAAEHDDDPESVYEENKKVENELNYQ
jgi:anionic cell wall polymer biosynthesis LytR-Cps2A-Psr (LCP) family protein